MPRGGQCCPRQCTQRHVRGAATRPPRWRRRPPRRCRARLILWLLHLQLYRHWRLARAGHAQIKGGRPGFRTHARLYLQHVVLTLHADGGAAGQVRRVAIVDWDVHHGNGTEEIVRQWANDHPDTKDELFFFSVHLWDLERAATRVVAESESEDEATNAGAASSNAAADERGPSRTSARIRTRAASRSSSRSGAGSIKSDAESPSGSPGGAARRTTRAAAAQAQAQAQVQAQAPEQSPVHRTRGRSRARAKAATASQKPAADEESDSSMADASARPDGGAAMMSPLRTRSGRRRGRRGSNASRGRAGSASSAGSGGATAEEDVDMEPPLPAASAFRRTTSKRKAPEADGEELEDAMNGGVGTPGRPPSSASGENWLFQWHCLGGPCLTVCGVAWHPLLPARRSRTHDTTVTSVHCDDIGKAAHACCCCCRSGWRRCTG